MQHCGVADVEDEVVGVACAFCGRNVAYTTTDPIALGIVNQWRPYVERPDETIYAHRACLFDRLDPELRELMELGRPDEE